MIKYIIKRIFQRVRRFLFIEVFQPVNETDSEYHHFVTLMDLGIGKNDGNITNTETARWFAPTEGRMHHHLSVLPKGLT